MEISKYLNSIVILIALVIFPASIFSTQGPMEVVKQSNKDVQDIFKTNQTVDTGIESKLMKVIDRATNFDIMAGRVTQRFCEKLTKDQCQTFEQVFTELLRVSSLKKMGRYRADRFEYIGEEITGDTAVVKTVAYYKEDKAALNYHLEKATDGQWKIVNYVLDDIDTIRNYKKQFSRLFSKKSFDDIIQRLRDKIEDYQKENRQ